MSVGTNGPSVEDDPNRDRTILEYMELSVNGNEQEMNLVINDIVGRIELGVDGANTFEAFLRELQRFISRDVSILESARGMEVLQKVLCRLDPLVLGLHEVAGLADLLSARLQHADSYNYRANMIDTFKCLELLSGMNRYRKEASFIPDIILSIPPSVFSQQLVDTRLFIYDALNCHLNKNRESLRKQANYGQKVTDGITALAVHEKDPSCLRIVFELYRMLGIDHEVWGVREEDLEKIWDSFVRYYPIKIGTFGQNAWGSSKPDPLLLKDLLLQCFTSNSGYGQWAFPRLLDLLDQNSDVSANVKNDVLNTLKACVHHYDEATVGKWSGKLWDSLKFEVLNGDNEEFIVGALDVIKELAGSITRSISESWTVDTDIPHFFITATNELKERLHEPAQRFTIQCGRILGAIASANSFTFHASIKLTMGVLLVIHQTLDTVSKKDHMMQLFNSLIAACPVAILTLSKTSETRTEALRTFKVYRPAIVEVYFEAMLRQVKADDADEVKYRVTVINGLSLLFRVPDIYTRHEGLLIEGRPVVDFYSFLSEYEKGTIVESLSGIVLEPASQDVVIFRAAVQALQITAVRDSGLFSRVTLENFLGHLPVSPPSNVEIKALLPKLNALVSISCSELALVLGSDGDEDSGKSLKKCRLFHGFSNALIKKLESVVHHKNHTQYSLAILATLYHGIASFDEALNREFSGSSPVLYDGQPSIGNTGPYGFIIMRLYSLFVVRKESDGNIPMYMGLRELPCGEVVDDRVLELVARLAATGLSSRHTVKGHSPFDWRKFQATKKQDSNSSKDISQLDETHQQATKIEGGGNTNLAVRPSEIWSLFDTSFPSDVSEFRQHDCVTGPKDKCSVNILSMGLLAGIPRDQKLNFNASDMASQMIQNAISDANGASNAARMSFIWMLQLLVNKFEAMKEINQNPQTPLARIRSLTSDAHNMTDFEAYRVYQVLAYTTSAALWSFDKSFPDLMDEMLSALSSPARGLKVAQSFRLLLAPSDFMNERHHCILRPLAISRVYNATVPWILNHMSNGVSMELKNSYLIAAAAIISYIPVSVLKSSAARIVPLLLAGTDVNNPGDDDRTKMDCISSLIQLIPQVPDIIEEHVDSIINRMTERTHNTMAEPSDASVECRVKALQCLNVLATHSRPLVILQRKPRVIKELDIALSDVSRTVRQAAERTKMVWFNITDEDVKDADEHAGHNH